MKPDDPYPCLNCGSITYYAQRYCSEECERLETGEFFEKFDRMLGEKSQLTMGDDPHEYEPF